MRIAVLFLFCASRFLQAADQSIFVEEPRMALKIAAAIAESKIDQLTPHLSNDGDDGKSQFSYHLASVAYLGTMERGSEKFILATALFMRSPPAGRERPPARGHGFLVCLAPDFHVRCFCGIDFPGQLELDGTRLKRITKFGAGLESESKLVADFGDHSDTARRRGFLIDGDTFLEYPFADRFGASTKRP